MIGLSTKLDASHLTHDGVQVAVHGDPLAGCQCEYVQLFPDGLEVLFHVGGSGMIDACMMQVLFALIGARCSISGLGLQVRCACSLRPRVGPTFTG